ncbi:MAG: hypothetical protein H6737_05220 [Alphaproteobacteria bacterium]|nr:hypothetical protein [Alphaproteobacteria bacterium]
MSQLSEPYLSWWIAVLGEPPPHEPLADCANCPMCAEGKFLPEVKCCGYVPAIPNFRAGGALRAGGEARAYIERRLRTGRPTETWLRPTAEEEATYDRTRMRFGQTDASKCAYVTERGTCAIWAWRNATCATWFCRHGHGEVGGALWDAAADLFRFAEGGVAVLVAGDGYEKAAERAASVTWDDLRRLGGHELAALEDALREAWATWRAADEAARPTPPPRGPRGGAR